MGEGDVGDVQEEVEIVNDDYVIKVVKYPGHDEDLLEKKMRKNVTVKDDENDKFVQLKSSPYLLLLRLHEVNLNRLDKLLQDNVKNGMEDSRWKAKSWTRMRCLREILERRGRNMKLSTTWTVKSELPK